ncbi:MAG TPA: hypothetical protein VF329_00200 [Gammaproteobacteria bacterium]
MRAINTHGSAILAAALIPFVGCTIVDPPAPQLRPDAIYLESSRGVWLDPAVRDQVFCLEGQYLVCSFGSGRLSAQWCQCPAL